MARRSLPPREAMGLGLATEPSSFPSTARGVLLVQVPGDLPAAQGHGSSDELEDECPCVFLQAAPQLQHQHFLVQPTETQVGQYGALHHSHLSPLGGKLPT